MRSQTRSFFFSFMVASAVISPAATAEIGVGGVRVEGTSLTIDLADGRALTGPDLTGFSLTVTDERSGMVDIRIDGAQPDGTGRGLHWLYDLKTQDAAGDWVPFCDRGPDGMQLGFPVAGWIDPTGMFQPSDLAMTFSCTGGVIAKCIRMGYAPWGDGNSSVSKLDRFRACTRMVRADYCGTGETHTRDGTPIHVYDHWSLHKSGSASGLAFEAAWGPTGALCVAKTRWADLMTLDRLRAECGEKLLNRIGAQCDPNTAHQLPAALVFNDS